MNQENNKRGCNLRKPAPPKPERNKPCACSSGKKYKHCCGSEAKLNEARREAELRQLEAVRARQAELQRMADERIKSAPPNEFTYLLKHRRPSSLLSATLAMASLSPIPLVCASTPPRKFPHPR